MLWLIFAALLLFSCAISKEPASPQSALNNSSQSINDGDVPRFASGFHDGIAWEARFGLPNCQHPGQAKGWCQSEDASAVTQATGIEQKLIDLSKDAKVKSILTSSFSFSNKKLKSALCEAAERGVQVKVYIHKDQAADAPACAGIEVKPRGTTFGSGYLLHAKIFLTSEHRNPAPLHEAPTQDQGKVTFTSASANFSSNGSTGMHYENWLFFSAPATERLAQENLCFFWAMEQMKAENQSGDKDQRPQLAQAFKQCRNKIKKPNRNELVFLPVPHDKVLAEPADYIYGMTSKAKKQLKVAAHRLTTASIYNPFIKAQDRDVDVHVLFDDDTLRSSKCQGGGAFDVGVFDVQALRALDKGKVKVSFIPTNSSPSGFSHLHHNKFIIADDKILFQGAGNFTAASLNTSSLGNIEHFYYITVPGIVSAYVKAWNYLKGISQYGDSAVPGTAGPHAVGKNKDIRIVGTGFDAKLDPSSCN